MPEESELQQLRAQVEHLAACIARLEAALGVAPVAASPRDVPPAFQPKPRSPLPPTAVRRSRQSGERTLESRIGSQWFNRVGIVAVLVGVSYFLKYAFENNWIGEAGRVAIGLIAGIAVVIWSEWFRRAGHLVFSWSLKAVGIGALYLSLWAAFQVYHLVPSEAAFAAMIAVTAATAVLAITEDAPVLAALALLGGFVTPLLLSTRQNREVALFSYVALLDLGTLALVIFRPWPRLIAGAFAGTLALYVGWWWSFYESSQLERTTFFTSAFFVIFAIAPLVASVRAEGTHRVSRLLLVLPLLNAVAFFLELYVMLADRHKAALAWTAVGLAAGYLALSNRVRRRTRLDAETASLLYLLHVGLAVGFLTAAIPLKLETHWITIGWLVEAAVLLWIGFRGASPFLKALATFALVLGVLRLLLLDNFNPEHLLLNARLFTYVIAIAAIAWGVWLANKSGDEAERLFAAVGVVAVNVLALFALTREANDYFSRDLVALTTAHHSGAWSPQAWQTIQQVNIARGFALSALWMGYGAILLWAGFLRRSAFLRWQAMVLLIVTIGKVFTYDVARLERGYRILSFIALGVLLLAISFVYQRDWLRLSHRTGDQTKGTPSPQ